MIKYTNSLLPNKPKIISEDKNIGVYEISSLLPGYGSTLGNSIRRMLISSIQGFAITKININGVSHEFSSIKGVKEDVIVLILNLKKINFKINIDEPTCTVKLKKKGIGLVHASDFTLPSQVEILNKDSYIAEITDKNTELEIECVIESGVGYVPREDLYKDRVEVGVIVPDAFFSPVKRASYEVSNMRVGNQTNFNKLVFTVETNGVITPHDAFELAITTMIAQLQSLVGFSEEREMTVIPEDKMKSIKISELNFSPSVFKALDDAGIKTIEILSGKKESFINKLPGIGPKAVVDIKKMLSGYGITLEE